MAENVQFCSVARTERSLLRADVFYVICPDCSPPFVVSFITENLSDLDDGNAANNGGNPEPNTMLSRGDVFECSALDFWLLMCEHNRFTFRHLLGLRFPAVLMHKVQSVDQELISVSH